ncbi:hypothetical protein TNCV_1290001 [Trichonephila clavipes]|nr:hypothetical protein TNCV_1290001 [Trichonephila clavipes]
MNINFCVRLGESAAEAYEILKEILGYYYELKLLNGVDVSEKAGKMSETRNALDVRRLSTLLKTSKKYLQRAVRTGFKQ